MVEDDGALGDESAARDEIAVPDVAIVGDAGIRGIVDRDEAVGEGGRKGHRAL